jgi:ABC-type multidrug transport system ATPase subunit
LLSLLNYSGEIWVNGFEVSRQGRAARRMIGYVPQELAFYDDLTTLDTVYLFARLKKVPPVLAARVLEQVGLSEHAGKPVGALSGGMKQRLALGLALIADPPVLVMDEPTSNLDAAARNQLLKLLAEVKAAGKTVLFTSHRLEEVEALANQVVVMEKGQVRLTCGAATLAQNLGLRTEIKLRMPLTVVDRAISVLQADGLAARRNGTGIFVEVAPDEKAKPIHILSRAQIQVTDFEVE